MAYAFEKKKQVNERVPFSNLEHILPLNSVGLSVCVRVCVNVCAVNSNSA